MMPFQNVSTNSGEHAHVAHIKALKSSVNQRGDWERQILVVHTRKDTMVRATSRINGKKCSVLIIFDESDNIAEIWRSDVVVDKDDIGESWIDSLVSPTIKRQLSQQQADIDCHQKRYELIIYDH